MNDKIVNSALLVDISNSINRLKVKITTPFEVCFENAPM